MQIGTRGELLSRFIVVVVLNIISGWICIVC